MSKIRKYAAALGLLVALFVSTTAVAAPRRDAPEPPDGISRLATFVVRMLEDIRIILPGG
jgi:hypothetical protein